MCHNVIQRFEDRRVSGYQNMQLRLVQQNSQKKEAFKLACNFYHLLHQSTLGSRISDRDLFEILRMLLKGTCRKEHAAFVGAKLYVAFRKVFRVLKTRHNSASKAQSVDGNRTGTFFVSRKQYPYTWLFSRCSFLSNSSPRSLPVL